MKAICMAGTRYSIQPQVLVLYLNSAGVRYTAGIVAGTTKKGRPLREPLPGTYFSEHMTFHVVVPKDGN